MENIESKVNHQMSESAIPHRYAVIDSPEEIQLIQISLRDKFLRNSNQKHKTGKLSIEEYVSCQLEVSGTKKVWYLYNLHTDMPGTRKDRYWNILGSGEYEHWSLAEVELNFPLESDRSMQAAFVKDDEDFN